MNNTDNYNQVSEIASKHLGKVGGEGYKDQYDPTLLVKIPRKLNRTAYDIDEKKLPFVGYDVWNAYEVSALTNNGRPVSGMLKIVYPADSKNHVESKSLKLYLNSFNMTKMGYNYFHVVENIENTVARDLCTLLETKVQVTMFFDNSSKEEQSIEEGFTDIATLTDLEEIKFNNYTSDESILRFSKIGNSERYRLKSDLLRSNCRVTNQPDWGDIFIDIVTDKVPDYGSIAEYIVSHRKVNHFHEEVTEMVFQHFMKVYEPQELMIACLYTRRGGIDLNPVRSTFSSLIPHALRSSDIRLSKTLRQ